MEIFEQLVKRARRSKARVVFPESRHPRVLEAARQLLDEGLAQPVLCGDNIYIRPAAETAGVNLAGMEFLAVSNERLQRYAQQYCCARPRTGSKVAVRLLKRSVVTFAAMAVACDEADAMVAGIEHPTARVIEAGRMAIGLADGLNTPSSYFLMIVPPTGPQPCRTLLFADCAVNVEPDARELADIALASAQSAAGILQSVPRLAMLSFSTQGSAKHARVNKVRQALALIQEADPELLVDGELQVDSALDPHVAKAKCSKHSEVAGQANVLIFPDLDAGNIGYKLVQQLAGAQAIGPVLQGFAKPISDLSRSASVDEIVKTTVLLVAGISSNC